MQLVNTHCHSKYCGHGAGEINEYVEAAKRSGLTTLAFTDHYPLTPAFDPKEYLSVLPQDMPLYEQAVLDARRENPDLDILLGVELDYLGADEDRDITTADLSRFDIVLGSVHFVDRWAFDDPDQRSVWEEEGQADRIWQRYVDLWCEAAADTSLRFDVMSHPDLAKKFAYYPSFNLQPMYERMAEAACAGDRMVEVNTSGAYYACAEIFPAPALLQQFCRAGVPCTVGSDAHDPKYVARDIEKAYRLMYDAGYRYVTVVTQGGDRRIIPIE
ncbi:histidinol-phosphatase HisJ family protein [Adlercreutzia sp. ZJ304]|uniref:histidinol-phosphatase HisJ family protein n=1 Tax=Adlercreutzia sp. ZJ304 TaxID=2709791 RepID=UPI0013EA7D2C|nr:histidinol-phosphatase HisJ family protein [Adlercreutzia sp. ZJ304]